MHKIKIALSIVAALVVIVLGNTISDSPADEITNTKLMLTFALVSCFIYLHYMFHTYLNPIPTLTMEQRRALTTYAGNHYYNSFFKGTVAFGYMFFLMNIIPAYNLEINSNENNFLLTSVFLVIFGTAAKARGLNLSEIKDCRSFSFVLIICTPGYTR